MKKYFEITSISREDLIELGYTKGQSNKISDEIMERIARKMADDYCDQLFWSSLEMIAGNVLSDEKIIPKKRKYQKSSKF